MQKRFVIDKKTSNLKIDKALQHYLPTLSRRAIRRALDTGAICINGRVERFASKQVYSGNVLTINIIETPRKKENIIIQEPFIAYEDEKILAINKPPFVASQKTVNKNIIDAKTLLLNYLKDKGREPNFKLTLCHRLDKETSGVLVLRNQKKQVIGL